MLLVSFADMATLVSTIHKYPNVKSKAYSNARHPGGYHYTRAKAQEEEKRRTRVPPGRDLGAGTDEGRREDLTPQKVQGRDLETIIWEKFMEKPKQKTTLSRQAG